MNRKKFPLGVIFVSVFLLAAFGFSLYATTRKGSNAIDSRASGNRDWSSVYPWKEQTVLSSLPGSGDFQSLNEREQGSIIVRTLFRNNHLYSQTVPLVQSAPVWANASAWNETTDLSSLPGSGDFQQLSEYTVNTILVRHLFRNNRLYVHRVPIKNGAPDWSNAPGWTETMDTQSLPGEGNIQSLTERIQGKYLMRTLFRSNRMFIQTVPLVDGAPQWMRVHPWKKISDLSSLPGSGTFDALSEYILGSNLVRTLLRNGHMYSQTVPIAQGKTDWSKASVWNETVNLSSLPGSGTFETLSEPIVNNVMTRILFRSGAMYFQTVEIVNGKADWTHASQWQQQTDLTTFPGSGVVQVMSEYLARDGVVRTVIRNGSMYTQTVPLTGN